MAPALPTLPQTTQLSSVRRASCSFLGISMVEVPMLPGMSRLRLGRAGQSSRRQGSP
jgi:hypothetical protein